MTKTKKISIIIGLIIFLAVIYLGIGVYSYFDSYTDVKEFTIEGNVYDLKSNKPIENGIIKITNYISGETGVKLDEYEREETYKINTNSEGYYFIKVKKGTYLALGCDKKGYSPEVKQSYAKKKMKIDFYLKKE